jgi:hypothetical protein
MSADGRFVAFASSATNLSPDDLDATQDIFVRDRATDRTILVSRATGPGGRGRRRRIRGAVDLGRRPLRDLLVEREQPVGRGRGRHERRLRA